MKQGIYVYSVRLINGYVCIYWCFISWGAARLVYFKERHGRPASASRVAPLGESPTSCNPASQVSPRYLDLLFLRIMTNK